LRQDDGNVVQIDTSLISISRRFSGSGRQVFFRRA